jgi:hypothetical protein
MFNIFSDSKMDTSRFKLGTIIGIALSILFSLSSLLFLLLCFVFRKYLRERCSCLNRQTVISPQPSHFEMYKICYDV